MVEGLHLHRRHRTILPRRRGPMSETPAVDVLVVGGGVLGTMHAWTALARGHHVRHLERDADARSASVRNFGLVWVSGRRSGEELALARRARERWEEFGRQVPAAGFRPHGSLTIALDPAELAAMDAFVASGEAAARDTVLLDTAEIRALAPVVRGPVLGALHCRADAIVEPRLVPRAARAVMAAGGRYEFLPNRHVLDVRSHATGATAIDHTGAIHQADVIVLCTGAVHDGVAAEHLGSAPLRRCQLQMLQTEPLDERLPTSIADADSMRYYPAYAGLDLSSLPPQPAVAAASAAQLLLVQRLDGSLTIGDTHAYDEPFPFDVDEAPYQHLLERAATILGRPLPAARRRWSGVYSQLTTDGVYHHAELAPGVVVVTGPGGRGMTLSPAIAERTWELLT
jgi:FAD dependent oxidoreductase TIGR03364